MGKLFEADDYLLTNVLLLFLLINFNLQIGTIYGVMAIVDWIAYYVAFDKSAFKLIPLERDKKRRYTSLIYAAGFYVGFILLVNVISSQFSVSTVAEYDSVFEYVSALIATTFSATPILYGSKYLRLVVWGILIPIIETRFFFRTLLQWGIQAAGAKFPKSAFSKNGLMVCGFFGAAFAIFHIVAKGITNNLALTVTFVFGALSAGLVIHYREYLIAIFLHLITNTIATMQSLALGFFKRGVMGFNTEGVFILGGVIVASWLLLFQEIPLIKPSGVRV